MISGDQTLGHLKKIWKLDQTERVTLVATVRNLKYSNVLKFSKLYLKCKASISVYLNFPLLKNTEFLLSVEYKKMTQIVK